MTGRPTDHKNIDLTQLHHDIAFRRAGGKVIWQPRIGCWISDKHFAGKPLPEPYEGMTMPQIYRHLECSNRIYDFNGCFGSTEDPSVHVTTKNLNDTDYEVIVETPVGNQKAVYRKSLNSPWHKPIKRIIDCEEEMKVAVWREYRRKWSWNQSLYEKICEQWAGLGAPTMYLPRVTVQKLYIDEMGVENAIFALNDYTDTCEAYFDALQHNQEQLIEVINASPIQIINFGDNVHAGTLPPSLFKKYVLPAYQRRCELLHSAGKFVHSHWDGDCRPLLPYAKDTDMDGIEAITPIPQGDVTLEETKEALGDMFLIDGIPAIYFDKTFSEDVLIECAKKCIELFAPNLILGISDEISSDGDIERIRLVGQVVDDYNASL